MNAVNDLFIHRGAQYHLDDVHRVFVSNPHAVDKFGLYVETLQQFANLWPPTVHHNRIHAHQLHQHHVAGKTLLEFPIGHGVAAKLDDKGFAREALDVGQ